MDEDCPYHGIYQVTLRSQEIRSDRTQGISFGSKQFCRHPKHSPMSEREAKGTTGRGPIFCNGKFPACHLTPDEFTDTQRDPDSED